MPDPTRAAAYLRYSTGHDQELSAEQQLEQISAFCLAHGYALTRVFQDLARSGASTAGRDAFLDMIRYLANDVGGAAPERTLVFWSYSRFARDFDDSMFYLAQLRQYGVRILSVSDPIPDTLDGRILESLVAWQHAKFRETLAKDVRRGMRFAIATHHAVYGKIPTGYTSEPLTLGLRKDGSPHVVNRLVVDPLTAPRVALAFQLRAAGRTIREIHELVHLFPHRESYGHFFRNKVYLGILEWGGDQYVDYAPPLIDLAVWQAVQSVNLQND
jgi:site-specific DNA recombinase